MGRLLDEDDIINAIEDYGVIDGYNDTLQIIGMIKELPSAQPVHNTGKWVRGTCHGLGVYNWTCKCGHVIVATVPDRFCGACGCDNKEIRGGLDLTHRFSRFK